MEQRQRSSRSVHDAAQVQVMLRKHEGLTWLLCEDTKLGVAMSHSPHSSQGALERQALAVPHQQTPCAVRCIEARSTRRWRRNGDAASTPRCRRHHHGSGYHLRGCCACLSLRRRWLAQAAVQTQHRLFMWASNRAPLREARWR